MREAKASLIGQRMWCFLHFSTYSFFFSPRCCFFFAASAPTLNAFLLRVFSFDPLCFFESLRSILFGFRHPLPPSQCLVPPPCVPNLEEPARCLPHLRQTAGSPFFSKPCSLEQKPQTMRVATVATSGGWSASAAAESSWQTSQA